LVAVTRAESRGRLVCRAGNIVRTTVLLSVPVVIAVLSIVPMLQFGSLEAASMKRGYGRKVVVELKSGDDPAIASKLEGETFIVGTTQQFAFF